MKKKIFIIIFFILVLISIISYAKYKNEYYIEAIQIITDLEKPEVSVNYSNKNYTNKNVDIILEFSEEIKQIDGFVKINETKYKKTVNKNCEEKIEFYDLVGNSNFLEYEVSWIDKQPPKIIGIENNKTYSSIQKVSYIDDFSGIKNIEKVYFGDLEIGIIDYVQKEKYIDFKIKVLRKPKNIKQIIFYKVENGVSQINKILEDTNRYRIGTLENIKFYVEVIDINGKKYNSKVIDKNNINNFINISKKYNEEDLNTYSNPGNYEIKVTDKANNKTIYTIQIQK